MTKQGKSKNILSFTMSMIGFVNKLRFPKTHLLPIDVAVRRPTFKSLRENKTENLQSQHRADSASNCNFG